MTKLCKTARLLYKLIELYYIIDNKSFGTKPWWLCASRISYALKFQNVALSMIRCKKNRLEWPDLGIKEISCKSYKSILSTRVYKVYQDNKSCLTNLYMQNTSLKCRNKIKLQKNRKLETRNKQLTKFNSILIAINNLPSNLYLLFSILYLSPYITPIFSAKIV